MTLVFQPLNPIDMLYFLAALAILIAIFETYKLTKYDCIQVCFT